MVRPAADEPTVSRTTAIWGILLSSSAALPISPQGQSFLELLLEQFHRGLLEGLMMLVGFGSPFLFGLTVAIGVTVLEPRIARRVVRLPIAMMHSQLMLVAIVLWRLGDVVASLPLLGFAVTSGVFMALHSARTFAEGDGPSLPWYVRWGATVVAAVGGWCELQRIGGLQLGWGLHVGLAAALLMVASVGSGPHRAAAPEEADPEYG